MYLFNNYPEDVKKIINEKKYTDVLTYYYNNTNNIQIGTFVSNNYDMLRYGYIPEYSNDTGVLIVNICNLEKLTSLSQKDHHN